LLSGRLNSLQKLSVLAMLVEKCEILRLGASKRDNQEVLAIYSAKLEHYSKMKNLNRETLDG